MGFDNSVVQLLCAARRRGVDFGEVATIGRQMFFPSRPVLDQIFRALDVSPADEAAFHAAPGSEAFLELLGARRVDSVDYSDYEGATIIQDLNRPAPPELHNRFDVVIDGGSLEHVFNVPEALKTMMRMVKVGGWFIQITTANNQMGHGFWQFSPELMFRCFSPENGFDPPSVLLKECWSGGAWHEVRDPKEVRSRVQLSNLHPTYICVLARKREDVEPFATPPYQSDYAEVWDRKATNMRGELQPRSLRPRDLIPTGLKAKLKDVAAGVRAFKAYHPRHYRRIPLDALLRGEFGPPAAPDA